MRQTPQGADKENWPNPILFNLNDQIYIIKLRYCVLTISYNLILCL